MTYLLTHPPIYLNPCPSTNLPTYLQKYPHKHFLFSYICPQLPNCSTSYLPNFSPNPPNYLPTYLPTNLPMNPSNCLPTYLPSCLLINPPPILPTQLPTLLTYPPTPLTCLCARLTTHLSTFLLTHLHLTYPPSLLTHVFTFLSVFISSH